jgi:hypothetical protein
MHRRRKQQQQQNSTDDNHVSNTTRTELDLSGIGCDNNDLEFDENLLNNDNNEYDLRPQRSQSAPVSPTKVYDKELASFIQCEQQQQQFIRDCFVYNIDLSDTIETTHQPHSRTEIFFVSILYVKNKYFELKRSNIELIEMRIERISKVMSR